MRLLDIGAGALIALTSTIPVGLAAQQTQVEDAVRATLEAWSDGDYETFVSFYADDVRGFFLDGGALMGSFDQATLEAARDAGFAANIELRDLDVRLYGNTAASVGYLVGTLTLPGGVTMDGTWRYTETRVRVDDRWSVVQFHFSEQRTPGF